MLIYLFEQVPGGSLLIVMELGFLGMKSLTSQNQFLLGLGINSDNQDSLMSTNLDIYVDRLSPTLNKLELGDVRPVRLFWMLSIP